MLTRRTLLTGRAGGTLHTSRTFRNFPLTDTFCPRATHSPCRALPWQTESSLMKSSLKALALSLLLSAVALAAPYTAKSDLFKADFQKAVIVEKTNLPGLGETRLYHDTKGDFKGNMVYVQKSRKPSEMLDSLKKKEAYLTRGTAVKRQVQGYDALRWNGVSEEGIPVEILIVQTKARSYLVISVNFDTSEQRRFLQSFEVID